MKELNITINKENIDYMHYIKKHLTHKKVKIFSAVCTVNEMAVLSIATNDADFNLITNKLRVLICDVIIYAYKESFLKENINLSNLNEVYQIALLKALVLFDSESDRQLIKSKLNFNGNIYLESLYNFKLKNLKVRWKEIATLANENSSNFLESEIFLDLLRFLVTTLKPKTELINVYFNGATFEYLDAKKKKIKNSHIINGSDEVSLITTLITLAPTKINLHCIDMLSNNTFKVLYYIFDKKVNLLV